METNNITVDYKKTYLLLFFLVMFSAQ